MEALGVLSAVSAATGLATNFKDMVETVYSIAGNLRSPSDKDTQEALEQLYVMKRLAEDLHREVNDGFGWWLLDAINDVLLEVKPSQKEQLLGRLQEKWQLVVPQVPLPRSQRESSSYQDLPPHLKRCFGFCSLFPDEWIFEREKLTRMWIAHGFITDSLRSCSTSSKEEDVAKGYFDDLVERCLFQKVVHQGIQDDRYEIHQEMHSMLRSEVARDYCLIIDGPCEAKDLPPTVRHLSVTTDSVEQLEDYPPAWLRKLRTLLVFVKNDNYHGTIDEKKVLKILKILKAVRVLDLSDTCIISELSKSTAAELTNVRYIALPKTIKALPGMEKMEKLEWADIAVEGRRVNTLEKLNSLRGTLSIKDLETVDSRNARKASLSKKKHVEVLKLEWGHRSLRRTQRSAASDLAVLDGLKPHPNLQKLHITFYAGTASPDWLGNRGALLNLTSLYLKDCRQLLALPPVGGLPLLKILSLDGLRAVEKIDGAFCCGPAAGGGLFAKLETMVLHDMRSLATWDTENAAAGDVILFPELKTVRITHCPKLTSLRGLLLHCRGSLQSLTVKECQRVAGTFSASMFPKLTHKDCQGLFKGC
ncbi:hypothetical protein ACP4OV_010366 [Aristida adscensionis]